MAMARRNMQANIISNLLFKGTGNVARLCLYFMYALAHMALGMAENDEFCM